MSPERSVLVNFQRPDLGQPALVAGSAAEVSRQEGLDELPRERDPEHFSTETTDVHVVIFDALVGTKDMVDESGTHAGNLVRGNGRSDTAAADRHTTFDLTRRDRPRQGNDEVGVVIVGAQLMRAKVHDLEASVLQRLHQKRFQPESSMVAGDSHSHHFPP